MKVYKKVINIIYDGNQNDLWRNVFVLKERIQNHRFLDTVEPLYTTVHGLVVYINYKWPPLPIMVVNVIKTVVKVIWINLYGILYVI